MRKFAQHFLINQHAVNRILETLDAGASDSVLEIGPGKGALTATLSKTVGRLTAVEIDPDWVAFLKKKFADTPAVVIEHGDILKFDLNRVSQDESVKVLGN